MAPIKEFQTPFINEQDCVCSDNRLQATQKIKSCQASTALRQTSLEENQMLLSCCGTWYAPDKPNTEFFSFRELHQELYSFSYVAVLCFFCSVLFPPDKLHYIKLMTLGLGLQKVVLQILEFYQARGVVPGNLKLFLVQGVTLKKTKR